jgi:hypothetical protein
VGEFQSAKRIQCLWGSFDRGLSRLSGAFFICFLFLDGVCLFWLGFDEEDADQFLIP